ncbi:PilZ domain-containing protein [bacterium]
MTDSSNTISDKRRLTRRKRLARYYTNNALIEIKITHKKTMVTGKILNLNAKGLCIICNELLNKSEKLELTINLPNINQFKNYKTQGYITWVEKIDENLFHYGIEIIDQNETENFPWIKYIKFYEDSMKKKGRRLIDNIEPSALSVDVTNLCNLKCKHCFWDSYKNLLPPSTNKNILNSVKKCFKKCPYNYKYYMVWRRTVN